MKKYTHDFSRFDSNTRFRFSKDNNRTILENRAQGELRYIIISTKMRICKQIYIGATRAKNLEGLKPKLFSQIIMFFSLSVRRTLS